MTIVRNTAPAGFENAHFPVHPEDEASIIALYNGGLGDGQIAHKLLFSVDVLQGILQRLVDENRIAPRTGRKAAAQPPMYRTQPQTPPAHAARKHKTDWKVMV